MPTANTVADLRNLIERIAARERTQPETVFVWYRDAAAVPPHVLSPDDMTTTQLAKACGVLRATLESLTEEPTCQPIN